MNTRTVLLAGLACMAAAFAVPVPAADPAPAAQGPAAGSAPPITQAELLARLERKDSGLVVLDVRTPAEFAAGHVPGARNVSHDQLAAKLDELSALRDKQVVLYCRSGRRTLLAEDTLRKAGFSKLMHLEGDYLAWEAEHRPIERSPLSEAAESH